MNSIPTRPVVFPFAQRIGGLLVGAMLMTSAARQASAQNYVWTTFVGRVGQTNGGDGIGTNAYFNQPTGAAMDSVGNLYVPDEYNNAIRKVTPDGTVSTFAGMLGFTNAGTNDGTGTNALFTQPTNLAFDKDGNLWVVDTYAHTVRRITPAGVVTTVAGVGNSPGFMDGTGSIARFNYPNGIAYDSNFDVMYVADGNNGAIRKVTQAGAVTTIAGPGMSEGTLYYGVEQVAVDPSHRVYILDAYNCTIWTVNSNGGSRADFAGTGTVKKYPGNAGTNNGTGSTARFDFPESMYLGPTSNLFVCNYQSSTIRKVTPSQVVSTIGGQAYVNGSQDGTNTQAQFNLPEGIFADAWNNVYVADTQSSTIRIGYAGPPVIVTAPQNLGTPAGSSPSFTVTAGGAAPRSAYQWKFNGTPLTNNAQISGAQSNILIIASVTLTNAGTYTVVVTNAAGPTNVSANLTVTLANPVITWTNPASIIYGTPLGTNQLDATANVPGTFSYSPTNGAVLRAATNTLTTVFTPADIADYSLATNTVSLVVSPAPLNVIASNASRLYGVANPSFTFGFGGFVNGEAATHGDVAGQPQLTCSADPTSPIGAYTISNHIGSLTSTNYGFTLVDGALTVNQTGLTITASNLSKVFAQTETFAGTEFSAAGLYNGNSVTNVLLTSAGTTNTAAVGPYPIVPSGAAGIGLSNYTVAYVNGTLTVTAPTPVIIGNPVPLTNGTVELTFSGGDPGVSYRIQATSSFPGSAWTNLSTNFAGGGGLTNFTDLQASNYPTRFYRTITP
jgi:hypothetical protein